MTASSQPGPESFLGIKPPVLGPTPSFGGQAALIDSNPDASPELAWAGWGVRDPDYMPKIGGSANVAGSYPNQDVGFFDAGFGLVVTDAAPATLGTANIAAAQAAASGTGLTLAVASTGITVLAAAFTVLPTGAIIPAGTLVLDGNPTWTNTAFAIFNPANGIARCVSVTANGGATGGVVLVSGYDIYGKAVSEAITAVAGTTVPGQKAFKFVTSTVPQFTDAGHTYSVGTTDVFGLNIRADYLAYTRFYWDGAAIVVTFVAADTTTATTTTNDVRGTIAPATASDGTRRLVVMVAPSVANVVASCASWAAVRAGLKGVDQI